MPLLDQKTLQDFISTKNLYPRIEEIGKKYSFDLNRLGYLASEIRRVITGTLRPGDLIPRIINQLEIPSAQAEEVARDINASIFSLIADHMQEINKGAKMPATSLAPTATTPIAPADIIKTIEKPAENSAPHSINILEHPAIAKMAPHELITVPQTNTTVNTPVVSTITETTLPATAPERTIKKYGIDPYREPIS